VIPKNPPKAKMEKVPKASCPKLMQTFRLSSYPMIPTIDMMRVSKGPILPITAPKAIIMASAHFTAAVMVLFCYFVLFIFAR
jgi:hypothetical protein